MDNVTSGPISKYVGVRDSGVITSAAVVPTTPVGLVWLSRAVGSRKICRLVHVMAALGGSTPLYKLRQIEFNPFLFDDLCRCSVDGYN